MVSWAYESDKLIAHRLTYDDILIRPGYSSVSSRLDCSPTYRGGLSPVVLANMDTLTTVPMAKALAMEGISVPFHRFQSVTEQISMIEDFLAWKNGFPDDSIPGRVPTCAAVGLPDKKEERFERIVDYCNTIFLDVAYANTSEVLSEAARIRRKFKGNLVVGNIATREAVRNLSGLVDSIKCGVGSGAVCTTRIVTGCGVPQVGALIECVEEAEKSDISVIADGGVKHAGDIVKALCLGAKHVMVGSLFAGTEESAGDGYDKRIYRGLASKDAQVDRFGNLPGWVAPEGISAVVPYKGPARKVAQILHASIRQSMAMVGARTLEELKSGTVLQVVSPSTRYENRPHILDRY